MDMRIANNNAMRAYEVQRTDKPAASERKSRAEERTDMVTLSSKAKDFAVAKKTLVSTPDIREDKVRSIKARIEAGTYNVSGMDVAEKLFAQS